MLSYMRCVLGIRQGQHRQLFQSLMQLIYRLAREGIVLCMLQGISEPSDLNIDCNHSCLVGVSTFMQE